VTTALTNLDVHDMARSARAFGAAAFWIVHPVEAQRELAERIREHWVEGSGKRRIPDRADALSLVRIVADLGGLWAELGGRERVEAWTTSARAGSMAFDEAARRLATEGRPVVLLFGTGWGLAREVVDGADERLQPIAGFEAPGVPAWNHLSVRAACAIALDRLRGGR